MRITDTIGGDTATIDHDNTNRGPMVKPAEAAELRAAIGGVRRLEDRVVTIDIGLFERLVHTAERG